MFELLKSYSTLAHSLNLSNAVRKLGSTSQTFRRHINLLEEVWGEKLFSIEDRQYLLRVAGLASLREADDILVWGKAWLGGHSSLLFLIDLQAADNLPFLLQRHPVTRIWTDVSSLLHESVKCWSVFAGNVQSDGFALLRPYLMFSGSMKRIGSALKWGGNHRLHLVW